MFAYILREIGLIKKKKKNYNINIYIHILTHINPITIWGNKFYALISSKINFYALIRTMAFEITGTFIPKGGESELEPKGGKNFSKPCTFVLYIPKLINCTISSSKCHKNLL